MHLLIDSAIGMWVLLVFEIILIFVEHIDAWIWGMMCFFEVTI